MNDISAETVRSILNYCPHTGVFTWKKPKRRSTAIGNRAGRLDSWGHRQICINGKSYMAHRLAWLYITGVWPKDQIDHVNGIRDDNRFCNIREASASENARNRKVRTGSASGYKGVVRNIGCSTWKASINFDGKYIHLGSYKTKEEAAIVYDRKARELFGEFHRTSGVSEKYSLASASLATPS